MNEHVVQLYRKLCKNGMTQNRSLSDFAFCLYGVYVQRWLLFTHHIYLLTLHVSA
jgi:hypothetical protein